MAKPDKDATGADLSDFSEMLTREPDLADLRDSVAKQNQAMDEVLGDLRKAVADRKQGDGK